jgi:hypothetical protein
LESWLFETDKVTTLHQGLTILVSHHLMDMTVIILTLTGCTLLAALVLIWHRRRKALPGAWPEQEDPFKRIAALKTQSPSPEDQLALERIEKALKGIGRKFSLKTSLAPRKVYAMAADLTRDIAAVYYPEAENPILKASLADLLNLDARVVARLNLKTNEFPLKAVKDVSIEKILAGKDFYDSKVKSKLEWFNKYKKLYALGNNAWLAYNALNPWYWGRRLAYTSVREITYRYLLTWVVAIVGEEAMAVYGRRDINTPEAVFDRDLAFAMVDMAHTQPVISGKTYAVVLDHILNRSRLNDTVRVNVLRALVSKKPSRETLLEGTYSPRQTRRFLAALNKVAAADGDLSPETAARLDAIAIALERPKTEDSV